MQGGVEMMRWDAKFGEPFTLHDRRTVANLAEAWALIVKLPVVRQRSSHWVHAGEMIIKAARGENCSVAQARTQFARALKVEGLIG
jgi:hypothetical protein